MKLFQQLLVAPAALGLLAPVAATAAEFNLDGVNKYASEEQVTSISQFSDVKPTDWAYQALSNLIERYGCVAGYPNGTYKGGKAMTRFEAAALLNACLDRVTDLTDELKKLMAEFEKELAILKGRVDGLEAKVGELEANQFSTTTKLKGLATLVGAVGVTSDAAVALDQVGECLVSPVGGLHISELADASDLLISGVLADTVDVEVGSVSSHRSQQAQGSRRNQQLLKEFHGCSSHEMAQCAGLIVPCQSMTAHGPCDREHNGLDNLPPRN